MAAVAVQDDEEQDPNGELGAAFLARKKLYDIDYVGNDSFVLSELNLLSRRSEEPNKGPEAKLSARGLFHRPLEHHKRDFLLSNSIIAGAQKRDRGKKSKASSQLLPPLFQRALASERLKQFDDAISDYSLILSIEDNATAYYNRSGIHRINGRHDLALADINEAIVLDPANFAYRNNKALMLRQSGDFFEAINETMVGRAILTIPEYVKSQVAEGGEILIQANALRKLSAPPDPIVTYLSLPKDERPEKGIACVVDFLSKLKFFAPFASDPLLMVDIASKVELCCRSLHEYIFEEGMIGEVFYVILDGEIEIVKTKKDDMGFVKDTTVLVKLFRGQTFGETAIESATGLRTAGALVSKAGTKLLEMQVGDYKRIVMSQKLVLRGEVKTVLQSCPAFRELTDEALNLLAEDAMLRNFGSNTDIQMSGEPSNLLFIVKQGIVKLSKRVKPPNVSDIRVTYSSSATKPFKQSPGLWVLEKSYTDPKHEKANLSLADKLKEERESHRDIDMTVGVLASGQLFGELAVLSPGAPSPLTARSFTPSEIYCFSGESILAAGAKFSNVCMNALQEGITLHNPPAQKLSYFFREKFAAEMLKIGALDVLGAHRNKKLR